MASLLRWNTRRLISSMTCLASKAALSVASNTSFKSSIDLTFSVRTVTFLLLSLRAWRASSNNSSMLATFASDFLRSRSASAALFKALSRSRFANPTCCWHSLRVSSSIALFSDSKKRTYSSWLTFSLVNLTISIPILWSSACMLSLVFIYAKVLKISEIAKF